MNIVIVNDFGHVEGGASQVALSSARGLADRGNRVILFCAVNPVMEGLSESVVEVFCTNQHEILKDPNRARAALQGIWNLKASRALKERLDSLEPSDTVVHVHTMTKALSSSVIRTSVRKGFRVVYTLHDYFIGCPAGSFFNFARNTVCDLKPLSSGCILINCDARRYLHKLYRVARHLVASRFGLLPAGTRDFVFVSRLSHEILRPYLPAGSNVYIISNPIDALPRSKIAASRNSDYVAVGRLSREKGCELFASAAKMTGVTAVFVGDGYYRPGVELANPSAIITGWLSRDGVNERLRRARALVFPSLPYETMGLVVLEAASFGVPAVVPKRSAASELVIDGVDGLHFRGGDVSDLARCLKLLKDDELAGRLGEAAYERFWENPYSMEDHLDRLEEVYSRVLSG